MSIVKVEQAGVAEECLKTVSAPKAMGVLEGSGCQCGYCQN